MGKQASACALFCAALLTMRCGCSTGAGSLGPLPTNDLPTSSQGLPPVMFVDIPYASLGGSDNVLDLYIPRTEIPANAPTILYVHGGGWRSGDKTDEAALCRLL